MKNNFIEDVRFCFMFYFEGSSLKALGTLIRRKVLIKNTNKNVITKSRKKRKIYVR